MSFSACLLFCLLGSLLSSSWAEEVPRDTPQVKSRCPAGTCSYNDGRAWYCYGFYEYWLPFDKAEAICRHNRNGSYLASIHSETQTRLISSYLAGVDRDKAEVWIGLDRPQDSDVHHGWRWTDASSLSYTNWLGGTPNNIAGDELCAILTPESGFKSWDDASCDQGRPFLCEWRIA